MIPSRNNSIVQSIDEEANLNAVKTVQVNELRESKMENKEILQQKETEKMIKVS